MRVCSLSREPAYEMLENHPDWKPSLLLGHGDVKATDLKRFERCAKRKKRTEGHAEKSEDKEGSKGLKTKVQVQLPPPHQDAENQSLVLPSHPDTKQSRLHTDKSPGEECALCQSRQDFINRLLEENKALKEELKQNKQLKEKREENRQVKEVMEEYIPIKEEIEEYVPIKEELD